jgi:hypothetical protein
VILGLPVTGLQARASTALAGKSQHEQHTRNGIITTTHYNINTFSRRRFTLAPAVSVNWTAKCL